MNHQCCPGGNRPETLRGGSPDILPKSLANPEEKKMKKKKSFLKIFSGPAEGGSPGGISAGTTLLVHMVLLILKIHTNEGIGMLHR